jgi:hypothetical protein
VSLWQPFVPLQEPDTSVYDAFLEQLAEDTKQYVIAVFKTLTATVPKAIIHAQVRILTVIHKPPMDSAMGMYQPSDESPTRSCWHTLSGGSGRLTPSPMALPALQHSDATPNSRSSAAPQVKQSQEHLLERLISYVHNLEPTQLEHLLEEDQEVTQKRAAAQMSLQVVLGR